MEVRTRVRGRAPADVVWERYAEPARWPSWAPQVTRVDCSAARIAPGVTGRVRGLGGVWLRFEVLEVDAVARQWSWRVRFGPVVLWLRHGVDRDGGSWLVLRAPVVLAVPYLPVAHLALLSLTRP